MFLFSVFPQITLIFTYYIHIDSSVPSIPLKCKTYKIANFTRILYSVTHSAVTRVVGKIIGWNFGSNSVITKDLKSWTYCCNGRVRWMSWHKTVTTYYYAQTHLGHSDKGRAIKELHACFSYFFCCWINRISYVMLCYVINIQCIILLHIATIRPKRPFVAHVILMP